MECKKCGVKKHNNGQELCFRCKPRKQSKYTKCAKCGCEKTNATSTPYCKPCNREYSKNLREFKEKNENKYDKKRIVDFIEKVERRNGYVSVYELLVELITLFNTLGKGSDMYNEYEPNKQLEKMYKDLKKKVNYDKRNMQRKEYKV